MAVIEKEKLFYEKFWKNLKGRFSNDQWHFASNNPYPAVKDYLTFLKKKKVEGNFLDLGCGNGRHTVPFAQQGYKSYGLDFSSEAIKLAKLNARENQADIKYLVGDVLSLPYKKDSFDVALDAGCLHHLRKYQWRAYLENLKKVLKPGSFFCLVCFSINSDKNIPKFGLGDKKRNWTIRKGHYNHIFYKEEIEELFKKDFEIQKIYEMQKGDYPFYYWVVFMQKKSLPLLN